MRSAVLALVLLTGCSTMTMRISRSELQTEPQPERGEGDRHLRGVHTDGQDLVLEVGL